MRKKGAGEKIDANKLPNRQLTAHIRSSEVCFVMGAESLYQCSIFPASSNRDIVLHFDRAK